MNEESGSVSRDVSKLVVGIETGQRRALAQGITLIESALPSDIQAAGELMQLLLPRHRRRLRVGLSGAPGVGKSSLIERLGLELIQVGKCPAVLAIDPSSDRNGGSLLADKTRMQALSVQAEAYVRPSPSGANGGGIADTTAESLFLCECAGFDPGLVETVGVGQAETSVVSVVDILVVLLEPGAGDELQGLKRGLLEWADIVVIHKADGDRYRRAQQSQVQYESALGLLRKTPFAPQVVTASSHDGQGIGDLWRLIEERELMLDAAGVLHKRRQRQLSQQLHHGLRRRVLREFLQQSGKRESLQELEAAVVSGSLSVARALEHLLRAQV